ncbi:MAG TPA: thioredoxin domain-containing protein [Solirubrobacterales bacterium]
MSGKKEREKRREERLQRESEAESGERRQRLLKLAAGAAFVAIAVVAVLIVISQSETDGGDGNLEGVAQVEDELSGITQRGLVLGDPGARVTLVEFGDLQCPVCKAAAEETLPDVIDSKVRSGEAKLDFRNFAILGPESEVAAAAAVAAGEQGRGWSFVEIFYRNQGFEGSGYVTDSFLTSIARAAEVPDIAKWNRDRRSAKAKRAVSQETTEAENLGLGGTPSYAVQGPSTAGLEPTPAVDAGDLEAAIEAAG